MGGEVVLIEGYLFELLLVALVHFAHLQQQVAQVDVRHKT